MADYFFVLDASEFEGRVRPSLADAWRLRRFDPARPLCVSMLSAAREYAGRYHTGSVEPILTRVAAGDLSFDRTLWRALVGEILLFSAVEIPEFQVNAETLRCLLAPSRYGDTDASRFQFEPIEQALAGTRDLTFGFAVYRPEHAGYNSADDVVRLARYLAEVRPDAWTVADLANLRDVPAADREDELAGAREWFPSLAGMYKRAAEHGQVIVHESIF
jgi:hypothetical protein